MGTRLRALARALQRNGAEEPLPPVAGRSAASFFAEPEGDMPVRRICHGASCFQRERPPASFASAIPVHCLGYCDRSPVAMDESGRLLTWTGEELADGDESHPSIRCQARKAIVTRNLAPGLGTPLAAARERGAYQALEAVLPGSPEALLDSVLDSGLRGRGGAAFPTGLKWQACARVDSRVKYVIANGDEGDPGSFIDRLLMEVDPHAVIEGLMLCGYAVGARHGLIYVRAEYPRAAAALEQALAECRAVRLLGERILGTRFSFDVRIARGRGSYVCGEETAMINAIEGMRGEVRMRPPYPTEAGLNDCPTVVDNVETLVNIPWIVANGAANYRALGSPESAGTKVLCLNAGFRKTGILEVEFGISLREVLEGWAGIRAESLAAVLLGGPMGSILTPEEWDVPVCYGAMSREGVRLGHGGLVAAPLDTDWDDLLRHWLGFMASESCGRCVPCSEGSRIALRRARAGSVDKTALADLFDLMSGTSLCAFGRLTPGPLRRILELRSSP
ncbi:MAG: NADH-ubiquinone oxidoreductase-F iron-sulfur binding region domain-containing protein [Xanthomonadales bacterium]|nr:NADH-ubiquinone oxidoreductase-F iron-sulfur binding region domain-containing protein [Xanthomonadales bacterium]